MLIASAVIQMVLQPLVAGVQAGFYPITVEQKQILTLLSSMPSAVLGSFFAVSAMSVRAIRPLPLL